MSGHAHDHGSATEAELAQRLRAGGYRLTAPRQAILRAVDTLQPGDALLICGKGHETGQEVAGVVHDHDDRTVARSALEEATA